MSDFDANEDPIGLPEAGQSDPLDRAEIQPPAELEPPVVRRARHLAHGHFPSRQGRPERRVGVTRLAWRRSASRRACPYGRGVSVLGTPLRQRRRLWTQCHGRPPGSQS
jgi:hypothetical protein